MPTNSLRIIEMGLRDGLQNEKVHVSVENRVELARELVAAGISDLEVGAFVSPKWVPQMQGSHEVIESLLKAKLAGELPKNVNLSALVPNERGMQEALAAGLKEVAVFAAASESFSKANINCTIAESFVRFEPVMKIAKQKKIKVRGYLSCCFWCPFEGAIAIKKVIPYVQQLLKMGCYEVSIGDTIGAASPIEVEKFFATLKRTLPLKKVAGHFHDTRGQALANVHTAYRLGVRSFDASVGGLGGCPYAPGAKGNVATEDILYSFRGKNIKSPISLPKLLALKPKLESAVKHEISSRVGGVGLPKGDDS